MSCTFVWRTLSIGLSVGLGVMAASGCQNVSKTTSLDAQPNNTVVISRNRDSYAMTMVKVYSLRGVGLNDAPPEEIQSFMDTMRKMVVSSSWDKTHSAVQVFGVLMTVRTTPENHLVIERYLNEVRQVMQLHQPLSMDTSMPLLQ